MPLIDAHQRAIDYLRVSVTDRCNLACTYCRPRTAMKVLSHADILSYEEMLRLITTAVSLGITRVRVTGGEPLVRRGIVDLIASITGIEGVQDVSLTTNGVLLAKYAKGLRAAGVSRLNISLDSLERERFQRITGSDAWDAVWQGIGLAEELEFQPIKINMVPVLGVNDDEIVAFAKLTLERRLHVRFIEFMPIGDRDRWHKDTCIPSSQVRSRIEEALGPLVPLASRTSAGPSDNYQVPGASGVIGFISPITKHFCGTCRRLRLTADGKIRPCLLSDTEIDIKAPLRSGCTDQELERLLRLALEVKPERHYLNDRGPETACFQRTMSKIGG